MAKQPGDAKVTKDAPPAPSSVAHEAVRRLEQLAADLEDANKEAAAISDLASIKLAADVVKLR
jgi:hypothetical protein